MAYNNQVKINLLFEADTSRALNNLQELGKLLQQISTNTTIGVDGGSIQQAVGAAQQLQIHLQQAMNTNTGKLDLTKLNSSLKQAGTDLQSLTNKLQALGPQGQQAFIKIATAVGNAQAPIRQTNKVLQELTTTLTNAVKWSLASSAVHAFMGSMSSAINYAKELDTALNDIRIVTGYGSNHMAEFAKQAQAAAEQLSTTSAEYAKAALIFYQQGLTGKDVTERTDAVIKMANVTGQSAKIVSDQMTAIWNNFDNGTKSLEYYADAITALGAATASSTDEIAAGLEKFAAISDSVGLSYEYATAALATVTAETRQSAETVGTAFKTIFARIQGLDLGDTLDDGVDLNKYSKALEKIGVNVLDANGNLRDMDSTLNAIGDKWVLLGNEQKTALAQTVAGVRQYSQFMALMENWDQVKLNVEVAQDSEGTLQSQQSIWEESWKAATNNVKNSLHNLWDNFIDTDTIIELTNGLADIIDVIDDVIDSFGGIGPMVLSLVGIFSKQLFPIVSSGFSKMVGNIKTGLGITAQQTQQMQQDMANQINNMIKQANVSDATKSQLEITSKLIEAKKNYAEITKNMSQAEKEEYDRKMQITEALAAETQKRLEHQNELEKEITLMERQMGMTTTYRADPKDQAAHDEKIETQTQKIEATKNDILITKSNIETKKQDISQTETEYGKAQEWTDFVQSSLKEVEKDSPEYEEMLTTLQEAQAEEQKKSEELERQKKLLEEQLQLLEEQETLLGQQETELSDLENEPLEKKVISKKDISHGTVSTMDNLSTPMTGETPIEQAQDQATSGLQSSVLQELSTTVEGPDIQVDASIANLEKLYQKIGELTVKEAELGAVSDDLNNAFSETSGFTGELSDNVQKAVAASNKQAKAEKSLVKAQENREKIAKTIIKLEKDGSKGGKDYEKALKALEDAEKDVAKETEKYSKASKEKEKIIRGLSASEKTQVKTLEGTRAALESAMKAANASGDEFKELDAIFDALGNNTASSQQIDVLKQKLENYRIATGNTIASSNDLGEALQGSLVEGGIASAETLNNLAQSQIELGTNGAQAAAGVDAVNQSLTEGQEAPMTFGTAMGNVVTGITSLAGSISTGIAGVQMITQAFAEGNTPMETFMGILSGMTMILPLVTAGISLLANAEKRKTIATTASTIAEKAATAARKLFSAETWKSIGGILANTVAVMGNMVAQYALLWVTNPVKAALVTAGLLAGAAAVAYGIWTLATMDQTKSLEEQGKVMGESSKQSQELAEANRELQKTWIEQTNTMNGLISKYHELKEAQKDTSQAEKDILAQAEKSLEHYKEVYKNFGWDMNGSIANLQDAITMGDVDKALKTMDYMDEIIAKKNVKVAQQGAEENISDTIYNSIKDDSELEKYGIRQSNYIDDDGKKIYRKAIVSDQLNWEDSETGSTESAKILQDAGLTTTFTDGTMGFRFDMTDAETFSSEYEALGEALKEMEKAGLQSDKNYQIAKATYDSLAEAAKANEEMLAQLQEAGIAKRMEDINNSYKDIANITSYEEYAKYKDQLMEGLNEEEKALAQQALAAQEHLQDIVVLDNRLTVLKKKYNDKEIDAIGKFIDGLSEEDRAIAMEIDFNKVDSLENFKSLFNLLKDKAAKEKLEIEIDYIDETKKKIDAGLEEEDFKKLLESGIFTEEEVDEFISSSTSQQQNMLDEKRQQKIVEKQEKSQSLLAQGEEAKGKIEGMTKEEVEEFNLISDVIQTRRGLEVDDQGFLKLWKTDDDGNLVHYNEAAKNFITQYGKLTGMTIPQGETVLASSAYDVAGKKLNSKLSTSPEAYKVAEEMSGTEQSWIGEDDLLVFADEWSANQTTIEEADKEAKQNKQEEQFKDYQLTRAKEGAGEIISTIVSGEELDDDQMAWIKMLEEEYPRLAEITDKSSAEYVAALKEIEEANKEAERSARDTKLAEEWSEMAKVKVDVDKVTNPLTTIEDKIDEFDKKINAVREFKVLMDSNIAAEIADINEATDRMQTGLEMIEEGGKVSADNIVALTAQFPGIIEGYKVLEDGSIQLNQNVMNSVLDTAQAEINSERQKIIEKLNLQIAYDEAMAKVYSDMAVAYAELEQQELEDTEKTEKGKAILEQGKAQATAISSQYEEEISGILAENKILDEEQVADASVTSSEDSAYNWAQAYDKIVDNSAKAATAAINNFKAIANQDLGAVVFDAKISSDIDTKDTTKDYSASGKTIGQLDEDLSGYVESGDYGKASETAKAISEAYTNAAASKKAQLAALQANGKELEHDTKNAGKKDGDKGGEKDDEPEDYSDQKKNLDEILERYEKINNELEDIERQVERMNKEADRLWGANRLNALKKVNKELENQKKALETKQQELNDNLYSDQQKAIEVGFTFDEAGRISNKDEMLAAATGEWNAVIDHLNSLSSKTEQDAFKETDEYKEAEGKIENLQKIAEMYEETRDAFEDNKDAITDLTYAIEDNNQLMLTEAYDMDKTLLDYSKQLSDAIKIELEGSFNIIAKKLADYSSQLNVSAGLTLSSITQTQDFLSNSAKANISQAAKIENIELGISDYLSSLSEAEALLEEYYSAYNTVLTAGIENIEDNLSLFDNLLNRVEHYQNILGLIHQEWNTEYRKNLINKEQEIITQAYKSDKDYLETLQNQYEQVQNKIKEFNNSGNEDINYLESLEQDAKALRETINSQTEKIQSDIEQMLESIQEMLDANLEEAKNKFSKALVGIEDQAKDKQLFGSLEQMTNQFDRQTQIQDMFLTKTNKMYKTSKMIRQAQLAMDKTDNELSKKKYQGYIKLVEGLQGQTEVSQEELNIARARYDLLQAQIALEEAQNAKSTVRLTRNAEGNWGYMYTADENKISDAEQKLEDAENKLYNAGLDTAKSYAEQRVEILNSMYEELTEIQEKAANGEYKTEEEKQREINRIREFYQKKYQNAEQQYNIGMDVLDNSDFGFNATTELIYGNELISSDDFEKAMNSYLNESDEALSQWNTDIQELNELLGYDVREMFNVQSEEMQQLSNDLKDSSSLVSKAIGDLEEVLINVNEILSDALKEDGSITKLRAAISTLPGEISGLISTLYAERIKGDNSTTSTGGSGVNSEEVPKVNNGAQEAIPQQETITQVGGQEQGQQSSSGNTFNHVGPNEKLNPKYEDVKLPEPSLMSSSNYQAYYDKVEEAYKPTQYPGNMLKSVMGYTNENGTFIKGTWGNGSVERGEWVYGRPDENSESDYYLVKRYADGGNKGGINQNIYYAWDVKNQTHVNLPGKYIEKYDTGGYTGSWGSEGKLATLHEKEIVLNKDDTANMFKIVDLTRSIIDSIGNFNLGSLFNNTPNVNYQNIGNLAMRDQTIKQEVHIQAEFPNVQDHNEIEIALQDMINQSSQYTYRTTI